MGGNWVIKSLSVPYSVRGLKGSVSRGSARLWQTSKSLPITFVDCDNEWKKI